MFFHCSYFHNSSIVVVQPFHSSTTKSNITRQHIQIPLRQSSEKGGAMYEFSVFGAIFCIRKGGGRYVHM